MKYYIDDHETIEDAITIPGWDGTGSFSGLLWAAEEAAEDHHNNHDGWESSWPLTFVILDDELNELGRFSVGREFVPQFYVTKF
jgi:hypothetical protein